MRPRIPTPCWLMGVHGDPLSTKQAKVLAQVPLGIPSDRRRRPRLSKIARRGPTLTGHVVDTTISHGDPRQRR